MTSDFTKLTNCLACGGTDLKQYCDLGAQPLANDFVIPIGGVQPDPVEYPLGLNVCTACWHSQNVCAVDPTILYTDYPYVSGTSASLQEYFKRFAARVEADFGYNTVPCQGGGADAYRPKQLRVLEIACNDGSLLKQFKARGHSVRGVDPARNVAEQAWNASIDVTVGFWDQHTAFLVRETDHPELVNEYDVVIAMNVLGHVVDPLTFLTLCRQVLAPGGRIYVQTSQAHMVENVEFDTVYAEHLSFFTAQSFCNLATRAGLYIENIQEMPVHGGSYLVTLVAPESGATTHIGREQPVADRLELETAAGLYDLATYDAFQQRVRDTIDLTRQILAAYRAGKRVVGYGAAAKAMTFVNALIPWVSKFPGAKRPIDYFVDDNPLKQGKLCPGSGIPVYPSEVLTAEKSDCLFVLSAWNMKTEIVEKIKTLRPGRRDLFYAYFPRPEMHG